jgi:hypothetical protein
MARATDDSAQATAEGEVAPEALTATATIDGALTEVARVPTADGSEVVFYQDDEAGVSVIAQTLAPEALESGALTLYDVESLETVAEMYATLVGQNTEPEVLGRLSAMDARNAEVAQQLERAIANGDIVAETALLPSDATEVPAEVVADIAAEQPAFGSTSQALCNEPAYNWSGDHSWFIGAYCAYGYQYCSSLLPSHEHKRRSDNFTTAGFAQSFCSSADFRLRYNYSYTTGTWPFKKRVSGGGTTYGATVPPRNIHIAVGKSGRVDFTWTSSIVSLDQGNVTGLTAFGWN